MRLIVTQLLQYARPVRVRRLRRPRSTPRGWSRTAWCWSARCWPRHASSVRRDFARHAASRRSTATNCSRCWSTCSSTRSTRCPTAAGSTSRPATCRADSVRDRRRRHRGRPGRRPDGPALQALRHAQEGRHRARAVDQPQHRSSATAATCAPARARTAQSGARFEVVRLRLDGQRRHGPGTGRHVVSTGLRRRSRALN